MALQYVGFPNTAGVPAAISAEDAYTRGTSDRTYTRRWTADEAGTITGLSVYWHDDVDADMFLIVYCQRGGSGDTDKIAQMDIGSNYTNNQWHGYETAVVFGGESLDFDSGDILWFGTAHDGATGEGGASTDTDDATGEVYNQYNSSTVNPSTGPANTLTFSTSGSWRGFCAILRYDDDVGGESIPIPIVMHHLTKNIGV